MKLTWTSVLVPAALLGAALLPLAAHADPPFFQGGDRHFQGAAPADAGFRWRGDVDDTTVISLHRRDVRMDTRAGKPASNVDSRMFGFLPERPVTVYLRHTEGRGHVRIVQQPSPDNDFTAVVRIHDPQAGRGHYAFELGWREPAFGGGQGRVFEGGGYR